MFIAFLPGPGEIMNPLSQLPSVDRLLATPALAPLIESCGRAVVTGLARETLAAAREAYRQGVPLPDEATLVSRVGAGVTAKMTPRLRPVLNLTGTVLHTNLGRAPLPEEAVQALVAAARSPCALEYDIESGGRGDRDDIVNELLCELTGAEAATVVNNNAAAVFLLLNTLAPKKQVIVSRGELIEIGGAFRMPDVMASAGATLVEVGTTNRTHLKDFAETIGPKTALLMKVHTSNYAVQGFTAAVDEAEMARIAHAHGLPMATDLGSGALVDMAQWVRLQLGRGKYEGKQLISARMADEMHQAHTVIRVDSASRASNPDTHLQAYGLGWFLEDYRGRMVVHHGGNVDGFTALVAMMPEEKLGLVFLTNMNGTGLPGTLMHKIFDLQLKAPAKDWSAEAYTRLEAQRARARQMQARQESQRAANTKPTLPLAAYAGTYVDSLYGDVVVKEENGKLQLTFGPNWRGQLEHYHYDAFRVKFDTPAASSSPSACRRRGGSTTWAAAPVR